MQRDHVAEFVLVKFKTPEYTQHKTEYGRRAVLTSNIKAFLSMEERMKQSYFRGTLSRNRLKNKAYKIRTPFY